MKKYFTPILVTVLALFGVITFNQAAGAADMSKFKAGNIMSDHVMSNKNSMTEAQIQAFLTKKNPCNNSNLSLIKGYEHLGFNIEAGKFVCLSKETFNGETAARIIWQAAQDYNINPQVLIVLLEKEQRLVTDTYPNQNIQYRNATGYGCPDNAPCEEKYYGFKNQVRNAANFFRAHLDNRSGWYKPHVPGGQNVKWSPSACGAGWVNIENRATSGLYSYTPYQPNRAALSAGYGSGDGCSSYGNRNFWAYFNDWFGSTQGVHWEPMKEPRILEVQQNTLKIYPSNNSLDSNWLTTSQHILFGSKTDLGDNKVCLRTQFDSIHNNPRCVLMERLGEFTPTYTALEERERIKSTTQYTCKVDLTNKEVPCINEDFHDNTQIEFSHKTNVLGDSYYITKEDASNNIRKGVLANRLRESYRYTSITPRYFKVTGSTNKYIPGTSTKERYLEKGSLISFSSVSKNNNKTYYRTTHDTSNGFNLIVKEEFLSDNVFESFLYPRQLKVNKDTSLINPLTGASCGQVNKNTIMHFNSKITFDNITYYRDANNSLQNKNCALKNTNLSEL